MTDGQTHHNTDILRVANISKTYRASRIWPWSRNNGSQLTALDGVDLDLRRGEILALVGESGSGKSTLAKILVGSIQPTSGSLDWDTPPTEQKGRHSARRVQMVFQDPYSSLNPRLSVRSMLTELLLLHRIVPRSKVSEECIRLLHQVGLDEDALEAYPSQFSGGQRQRLAIARALAVRPDVLIADEPVSALDVSVQATILELFGSLQRELGLSILFIAHNLAVVQHLSQRVAVMYLGRIVEVAETDEIFSNPRHPYTRALIDSIPRMNPGSSNARATIDGEPPSPFDIPSGCRFSPRCAFASDECRQIDPKLYDVAADHQAACIKSMALPPVIVPLAELKEKL